MIRLYEVPWSIHVELGFVACGTIVAALFRVAFTVEAFLASGMGKRCS
jgi:hypothetical protein